MPSVKWNPSLKLIVSDLDETIADVYKPAEKEMIKELEKLLKEGKVIFIITGQGIEGLEERVTSRIKKELRKKILLGTCLGAEVWGFDENGKLLEKPFYSLYESFSEAQKKKWRTLIQQLIKEFDLEVFPTMPRDDYRKKTKNPRAIMLADRGPQITFEVVNGTYLTEEQAKELNVPETNGHYDFRIPIMKRAEKLFKENKIPINPHLAGVFALNFSMKGASKTKAVRYVIENKKLLSSLGLKNLKNEDMEIWGDKFSIIRGGVDSQVSIALPKTVRSITFRKENPKEFPKGYNIVIWDGKKELHEGLLEFLKSR